MSPAWEYLAWRSLPVVLVLAWFLLLIGGFSLGGALHLLLLAGVAVFAYQLRTDRSP
ncbi:MAG: hypothetical protein H0W81_10145 [Chloroflexi bacterium]|nr:hypothetical protein [Chloroflexota bacterium]